MDMTETRIREDAHAIVQELFGCTMDEMRDENSPHCVGIEIRWIRFAEALALQRKRMGAPSPRQTTLALRGRAPHTIANLAGEHFTVPASIPGGTIGATDLPWTTISAGRLV